MAETDLGKQILSHNCIYLIPLLNVLQKDIKFKNQVIKEIYHKEIQDAFGIQHMFIRHIDNAIKLLETNLNKENAKMKNKLKAIIDLLIHLLNADSLDILVKERKDLNYEIKYEDPENPLIK